MTDKNIVLIGFMGTGKSSVGKILAKKTGRRVVDIDHLVEETHKRRISDIFEKEGEAYFRGLEKEAIRGLAGRRGLIITTGGGAVIDPDNMGSLRADGLLIELSARPETIHSRIKGTRHRPLLNTADVLGKIRRLLDERAVHYRQADWHIDTDGLTPDQVAEIISKRLEKDERFEDGKDWL